MGKGGTMENHEERMLDESRQLGEKIIKLKAFLKTETFKSLEAIDTFYLNGQLDAMKSYFNFLEYRIDRKGLRTVKAEVKILD